MPATHVKPHLLFYPPPVYCSETNGTFSAGTKTKLSIATPGTSSE